MKGLFKKLKSNLEKLGVIPKYLLIAFIIYFIFSNVDYLIILVLNLFGITKLSTPMAVMISSLKEVLLIIGLFIYYRKDLIKDWDIFRANPLDHMDTAVKYWFMGLFGMIVSNLVINFVFKGNGPSNELAVQDLLKTMPWLMGFTAAITGPIVEELVFRKSIKDAIPNNKWLFVLFSGLFFGFLHIANSMTSIIEILYIIPYSALGLSFALAYKETDTIFSTIFMHMIHNTIVVAISFLAAGMIF